MGHRPGCSIGDRPGVGAKPFHNLWMSAVPFKLNQDRRHHSPRLQHKTTNCVAYEASLCQHGSGRDNEYWVLPQSSCCPVSDRNA